MEKIIECVPNFSEGCRPEIIRAIAEAISHLSTGEQDESVKVLHIDPGKAANRTVITFAGNPEAVCEAAFRGARKAAELIDMRQHHGTHPRLGATDVLPLVPVSGISLDECKELARNLARRLYEELGIPCYCYEAAAFQPDRKNLAVCRAGEYEGLRNKMETAGKRPDFGPSEWTEMAAKAGATNVGARNFLIAVNFNLNSRSTETAQEIACDVREKGRKLLVDGEVQKDEEGKTLWQPGKLKGCKAIGWYIEEYGKAQVSMNITDVNATSLHKAYETVCESAHQRGQEITGTEIIGLVPKAVLLDAGRHFHKKKASMENSKEAVHFPTEEQLIQLAIDEMHLDELCPFVPQQRIIEYLL